MKQDPRATHTPSMARTVSARLHPLKTLPGLFSGLLLSTVIVLCAVAPGQATSTRHFLLDDAETWKKGELDGAVVHSEGKVTRGRFPVQRPLPDAPFALASVRGFSNDIFVATGPEGLVYRLTGETTTVFAKTETLAVTALAYDGGHLYAGTLPDGEVFRIDEQGSSESLGKLEKADHIWALTFDAKRNLLHAATGPAARLYSMDPALGSAAGAGARLRYDGESGHLLCLALDSDGSLLVGSDGEARLLRISEDSFTVVRDFEGSEVSALDVASGRIAVAVNEFPSPPTAPPDGSKSKSQPKRPKPGKGSAWLIDGEGRALALHQDDSSQFSAVEVNPRGGLFVGTGHKGRVLQVGENGSWALLAQIDERQVTDLHLADAEPYFLASDSGAIYGMEIGSKDSSWISESLDAGFLSRWGQLDWTGEGQVQMRTRSGNSKEPDDSWTAWSTPLRTPGAVASVSGRYLQIEALLAPEATLHVIRAYYLPRNQPTRIREVRLKNKDKDKKKKRPADAPPMANPIRHLTWKVDNPDGDQLRYRIHYRLEGQRRFIPMLREDQWLTSTTYAWDTRSAPDGFYQVRVTVSDEISNPAGYVLRRSALSAPLRVDNHAPRILDLQANKGQLRGRALDDLGPIFRLERSIDGRPWEVFFPDDGLLDEAEEAFEVPLDGVLPGEHLVAVRAFDAAGNLGSAQRLLTLPLN